MLWQKNRNVKNLKTEFQQRRVKPKRSIDKKTKIFPILYQFYHQHLNVGMYFYLSAIICHSKPVFNNVSRRNHSSLINNTVTKKIKYFLQLLALMPQIALKRRWHCFLVLSNHYCQTRYICLWVQRWSHFQVSIISYLLGHNKYLVYISCSK